VAARLGEELIGIDPFTSGLRGLKRNQSPGQELDHFSSSGMAHGASGLGLSLLELYGATGRVEFRNAARRFFEYEDTLFNPDKRNWVDLRGPSGAARFDRFWCNGAPGIALARLRASALDPERRADHLGKAGIAIATTLEAIDDGIRSARFDTSLCHGLAGLGEIILIAGQLLDEPSYHDRALVLARTLIDRYGSTYEWPSGVASGGPHPSLMLGLAGVGYWLLRLHDPSGVPPFLLFVPEEKLGAR
jgi:lantibiotic modifying enzyme